MVIVNHQGRKAEFPVDAGCARLEVLIDNDI